MVVAELDTTTEELIDLDGTNKMGVSGGTLSCGGFATTYVNGVSGSTVSAKIPTIMAVTDATGVSATDFDMFENSFNGIAKAVITSEDQLSAQQITQCTQYFKQLYSI